MLFFSWWAGLVCEWCACIEIFLHKNYRRGLLDLDSSVSFSNLTGASCTAMSGNVMDRCNSTSSISTLRWKMQQKPYFSEKDRISTFVLLRWNMLKYASRNSYGEWRYLSTPLCLARIAAACAASSRKLSTSETTSSSTLFLTVSSGATALTRSETFTHTKKKRINK